MKFLKQLGNWFTGTYQTPVGQMLLAQTQPKIEGTLAYYMGQDQIDQLFNQQNILQHINHQLQQAGLQPIQSLDELQSLQVDDPVVKEMIDSINSYIQSIRQLEQSPIYRLGLLYSSGAPFLQMLPQNMLKNMAKEVRLKRALNIAMEKLGLPKEFVELATANPNLLLLWVAEQMRQSQTTGGTGGGQLATTPYRSWEEVINLGLPQLNFSPPKVNITLPTPQRKQKKTKTSTETKASQPQDEWSALVDFVSKLSSIGKGQTLPSGHAKGDARGGRTK